MLCRPPPGGRLAPARSGNLTVVRLTNGLLLRALAASWFVASFATPGSAQFVDGTEAAGLTWNQTTWGGGLADMDGDADLDLYVGHHFYSPILFWNDGQGVFDADLYPQPWSGDIDRHGVLMLSLDGNERIDLLITHGADGGSGAEPDELYINDGPGLLFSILGAGGMDDPAGRGRAISAADFNGDRRVDVWVGKAPDPTSKNSLYRNDGSLSFVDVAASAGLNEGLGTVGGIWGDIDDDGDPDLLVGGEEFTRPTILWRNNGGTFSNSSSVFTPPLPVVSGADWGDADGDGDLDLAVVEGEVGVFDTFAEGDTATYFFNTRFGDTGIDGITVPSVADTAYARFAILAIAVASQVFLGPNGVHPQTSTNIPLTDEYVGAPAFDPGVDRGTFVWRQSPGGPWEIRCSTPNINFDNFDGWITDGSPIQGIVGHDLEDSGFTPGGARVWRNDGGTFSEITSQLGLAIMMNPRDVSWVDYDNDGDLDLHVVDMGTTAAPNAPDGLWRNDGAAFADVTIEENVAGGTEGMGDGAIWGDIDHDLDLDMVLREGAGPATFSAFAPAHLLVNDGERGNALGFYIVGRQSGAPAIGVRVTVVAGSQRIVRRVQANSWRGCQDPPWIHAGLGAAASADSVIVKWLTGSTQVFLNVPEGFWRIEEGLTITGVDDFAPEAVGGWRLAGIAPQPALGVQRVALSTPEETSLTVTVHDIAGRTLRTIHQGPVPSGSTSFSWDGRDQDGHPVSAGVYWIRATDGAVTHALKSVRVR